MSKIQDRIAEIDRASKKSRLINNILWAVVFGLVVFSGYMYLEAVKNKKIAVANEAVAVQARDSLRLLEEDLLGEKNKLEEFKKKYDKLMEERLSATDDLWQYAVDQNTFEAYMDYINIKGEEGIEAHKDELNAKLDGFLTKMGYVQFQESNSNMLFVPVPFGDRNDLFTPKSARSVRKGVIGKDKSYRRTGDVILEGQIVKVEEYIESGSSKWAKIKYSNS